MLPFRSQWKWLLFLSGIFFFVNCNWYTVVYLLADVLTIYLFTVYGIYTKHKQLLLTLTIILNFGILATLKYNKIILTPIALVLNHFGMTLLDGFQITWAAPLGISFYTLQVTSYLVECYWEQVEPEKNIFKVLLFTIYFPQMISGPINRYSDMSSSLFAEHRYEYKRVSYGLIRCGWGFFEKMVLANRLSLFVSAIFQGVHSNPGNYLWIGVLLFPLQLYTDFCGGMDIIMGVSECFGVELAENFKGPFYSKTMQELWHRFHITLGTWLRDYVMNTVLRTMLFIKLGKLFKKIFGKKVGRKVTTYIGMLILWACMGLWHGNGWKYIIGEGVWFWLVIILGQLLQPYEDKIIERLHISQRNYIYAFFRIIRTYICYAIGMMFFRADSYSDGIAIIRNVFNTANNYILCSEDFWGMTFAEMQRHIIYILIGFVPLCVVDKMRYEGISVRDRLHTHSGIIRWGLYYAIMILVALSSTLSTQEFLYAQF